MIWHIDHIGVIIVLILNMSSKDIKRKIKNLKIIIVNVSGHQHFHII